MKFELHLDPGQLAEPLAGRGQVLEKPPSPLASRVRASLASNVHLISSQGRFSVLCGSERRLVPVPRAAARVPRPGPVGGVIMPASTTGSSVTSSVYHPVAERAHVLLQDRVGSVQRQVRPGGVDDRPGAVVRRDRPLEGLGEGGNLAGLGDPADPAEIERSRPARRPRRSGRGTRASPRASRRRRAVSRWSPAPRPARRRLSTRTGSSIQYGANGSSAWAIRHAAGTSHSPCRSIMTSICMPDRRADLSDRLERQVDLRARYVVAAWLGVGIERPDLHRRDPFGEQIAGEVVGVVRNPSRSS